MGVYGKRRDLEGGILVGLFRGEVYCDGVFLASRSMGPDGRKTEPSNRTFVIRRPPAAPEVDPAVQRPDAYPVPTEGEYPGIVTDGPVLPERDLGERLQEFAESGEHLVLLLDRLPGAPITPSNLAEGKNGHLCREPEGPPDTMIRLAWSPRSENCPSEKATGEAALQAALYRSIVANSSRRSSGDANNRNSVTDCIRRLDWRSPGIKNTPAR